MFLLDETSQVNEAGIQSGLFSFNLRFFVIFRLIFVFIFCECVLIKWRIIIKVRNIKINVIIYSAQFFFLLFIYLFIYFYLQLYFSGHLESTY